jgi:hypothetical protein
MGLLAVILAVLQFSMLSLGLLLCGSMVICPDSESIITMKHLYPYLAVTSLATCVFSVYARE